MSSSAYEAYLVAIPVYVGTSARQVSDRAHMMPYTCLIWQLYNLVWQLCNLRAGM